MIAVVGSGLAGLAAAARLAREGHQVAVFDPRLAGSPTAVAGELPGEPDTSVFTLPAAWRDLFYKSGRTLDAELGKRGLSLVPAPPRRYRFANGATFDLPTDRGEQWTAWVEQLSEPAAIAWRDALDHLDRVWQVLRPLGLEAEFTDANQLTAEVRAVLRPRESLATLAGQFRWPELTEIVLDVAARLGQDPRRLPGWHAVRLSVERTFGRWQLVDAAGNAQPTDTLVALLVDRLRAARVELHSEPVLSVRSGTTGLRCRTEAAEHRVDAVVSTLDPAEHADLTDDKVDSKLAARLVRAPGGGPRWDSWRTLTSLPRLTSGVPGVLTASAWSPAGPDIWAQLLTGALAGYRMHAMLTGGDIRPANKAYRRPPPPRPARPTARRITG